MNQIANYIHAFIKWVRLFGISQAIKRVLSKMTGNRVYISLKSRPSFFVRDSGSGSDLAVCHQVFDEKEYSYACPREVRTIVDVGANIGCSAVFFAENYPNALIFSIEPSSSNFELLCKIH
jgi:hypothetical protein